MTQPETLTRLRFDSRNQKDYIGSTPSHPANPDEYGQTRRIPIADLSHGLVEYGLGPPPRAGMTILAVSVCACCLGLAGAGWAIYQLLLQNGKLRLRLDALEKRLYSQ